MNEKEMDLPLATEMTFASPVDVPVQRMQPRRPAPPAHLPVMREFSVSLGTADSTRGHAWILTPSQRPELEGHWYTPGTRVEIFASPAPGNIFTHWTLTNLSTGNVTTDRREVMAFTLRGHMAIEAHFSPRPPARPVPPIGRPPTHRPPVRPVPPAHRPPVRPVPPIGGQPTPRPPVRPVPPIGGQPAPRPPVTPVPPIGILPIPPQVD